ncbi:uncharacterized protein BX664DRAFT_333793 [Halteromyces radiatus]|uniref:uncharacterized protein n=1 Tax=Halteromyces radiatus TaxID=101107 RepID=UPI00221E49CD|nr:uncharacterized protein BX664DRAFT_333793 [Halteromyces radiatus]KAI8089745.1 hypothetical protein BX664DRAFT_333793 [Halteromyces radiatus]
MPLMTYKSGYEPKDARTINTYEEDDDFDDFDDWSLETTPPRPRRRKTGTQALVEFLNTTSPEEFQKLSPTTTHSTPTKRTSTPFFLRRRNKNKSTTSTPSASSTGATSSITSLYQQGAPNTIHRKNYIEIIAHNPRMFHYHDLNSGNTGVPLSTTTTNSSTIQTMATTSKISLNEPVLPTRRDSSLYAASIRSLSIKSPPSPYPTKINTTATTTTTTGTTATSSTTTTSSLNKSIITSKDNDNKDNNNKEMMKRKMVDDMIAACDGMDVIEAGLIQRLKQCQLYGIDKPMDVVTTLLTEEHIRALKVSSTGTTTWTNDQMEGKKKKVRHVQVQTLPWDGLTTINQDHEPFSSFTSTTTLQNRNSTSSDNTDSLLLVESLRQEIAQERQERQRLQAALEASCDHFEVLSGLAYKKLRELWEEKLRWENACIELNDKLVAHGLHYNTNSNLELNDPPMTEDYQHSEYQ